MDSVVIDVLIRKLSHSSFLTEADHATLRQIPLRTRSVAANQDLIQEGDRPENVILILSGLACRYKLLETGNRPIVALLMPGDFCDLHVAILGSMDHSISTLTQCVVAELPHEVIDDLTEHHPRITRALWWATLFDEGILREWLVSMGQRSAQRQMAHLFCELHTRFLLVDLATPNAFNFPLTQRELGDILGMSGVHVNRTLQELRAYNLVSLKGKRLEIPDVKALWSYCNFDPNYLHLVPRVDRAPPP